MVVPCYDWATFLSGHYRRIPGLLSLHSSDEVVDVMTVKELTDSVPRKLTIGKGTIPAGLPPSITPAGLSLDRQRYLHSDIREFCRDGTAYLVKVGGVASEQQANEWLAGYSKTTKTTWRARRKETPAPKSVLYRVGN